MAAKSVRALCESVPGAYLLGDGERLVTGIAYDSRSVRPGDLFAALRGSAFDGHTFVADAESCSAAAVLVETPVKTLLPQIVVGDSRAGLAQLSAAFFDDPSRELGVIGITGTDGKTTTAYLVDHILRASGVPSGMVGTIAIRIGDRENLHPSRQTTPESSDIQRFLREMVVAESAWAVLEATSHGLAMHRLDNVRFRIGAVTNVTHEHLDFHGTIAEYRRSKASLFERVGAEGGVAVVNADDEGACAIGAADGATMLRYSMSGRDAELRATSICMDADGSRFVLDAGDMGQVNIVLPLIGSFNIANALCAAGIALATGMSLTDIGKALATAPPVPGRMADVAMGQPFHVVVDYAHTPDAMEKVLSLLRQLHRKGRLIVVFGSAGERDIEKRPRQGEVAARLADITIVTSEDPRFEDANAIIDQIATGARAAGAIEEESLFWQTDRAEAIRLAFRLARSGDCVLLAGKGHETSIIWGGEKVSWDEAGVARQLLREAGYELAES